MTAHYNLIVIGAGPAGAQAAAQAAGLGKRVALVEREPYRGGSGLTTGTMPSKQLRDAAVTLAALRQRGLAQLQYTLQPDTRLSDLMYNKIVNVEAAWSVIQRNIERQHIKSVRGAAVFQDAHLLSVTRTAEEGPVEEIFSGDTILVATGSKPVHPALFPFDHPQVRDAESILRLERLPRSLAVVGGGTIGCEYASIFQALGVRVTLVEKQARLLGAVDVELAQHWQQLLEGQGARFCLNEAVAQVELPASGQAGEVQLVLTGGQTVAAEVVLVAVGRRGNVDDLNLTAAGLTVNENGFIAVNEDFQTNVPHIYAAGDVIGLPASASASMEQGRRAVEHAFEHAGSNSATIYPVAVYTIPEMAMVGLAEEACRRHGIACAVGRADFANNPHAQITGDTSGLLKLIFDPTNQRLLGVQLMCAGAADLIHLGAYVLATGGTLGAFTHAIYNYPTLSEAYKAAALDGLDRLRRKAEGGLGD